MLADLVTILNGYGGSVVSRIQSNLQSTGTNATGKTSRSLRFEVRQEGSKTTLKVIGKPYFAVVETGRKPTPQYDKPSKAFVDSIREWTQAKGLPNSLAYAIAKSIHKKGTELFKKGGRKDIISNVINDSLASQISKDILQNFAKLYAANIVRQYGSINSK